MPPHQTRSEAEFSQELSQLPASLRAQLSDALVLGVTTQIAGVLQQIRVVWPELADTLTRAIGDFDYAPLLDARELEIAPL